MRLKQPIPLASARPVRSIPRMINCLKAFFVFLLIFIGLDARSQWGTNSTGINYNGGNVGIGTTAPAYPLHVEGDGFFSGDLYLGAPLESMGYGKKIDFGNYGTTDRLSIYRFNAGVDASELRFNIGDDGGSGDKFVIGYHWYADGNWAPQMTFRADGRVGIGTTNLGSGYRLFVEEGIRTRKVKVDQAAWPDYVFHPTYRLRPLSEVEQYIQQNHHLPDVPSAEEVKKEGIDLGDTQAILLKKIEELTLYLIEEHKKNDAQQKEIEVLKKLVQQHN